MTKKHFFVSFIASCFIISCSDSNNEILEIDYKSTDNNISGRLLPSQPSITYPVVLSVTQASGVENFTNETITINPNYTYYDDYHVYAGDSYYSEPTPNCLGDGKPCINLSHFLAMNGAYIQPNASSSVGNSGKMVFYYGENNYYNFAQHPMPKGATGYSTEQSFTINEYGSSSPLFGYSTYMTNDAANAVLHQFKDMVAEIPNNYQGKTPKIFAAHFQYQSWLSIPPHRQAKMTVKYYY